MKNAQPLNLQNSQQKQQLQQRNMQNAQQHGLQSAQQHKLQSAQQGTSAIEESSRKRLPHAETLAQSLAAPAMHGGYGGAGQRVAEAGEAQAQMHQETLKQQHQLLLLGDGLYGQFPPYGDAMHDHDHHHSLHGHAFLADAGAKVADLPTEVSMSPVFTPSPNLQSVTVNDSPAFVADGAKSVSSELTPDVPGRIVGEGLAGAAPAGAGYWNKGGKKVAETKDRLLALAAPPGPDASKSVDEPLSVPLVKEDLRPSASIP